MAIHFQTDNNKYTNKLSRVGNNPDFQPAVDVNGQMNKIGISSNLDKWAGLIGYLRFFPDTFFDLIRPKEGCKIRLTLDQRVQLRCLARFISNYIVLPRGSGKSMICVMWAVFTCIFYPTIQISLSAQTRENSAKIIKDKYEELLLSYPLIKEEVYSVKTNKDSIEIVFQNGSKFDNIANHPSSKGAHRQRGIIDEDNLTNSELYQDVLEPIFTTVKRNTVGPACVIDPMELNGAIAKCTSSGYRGSAAFFRCLKHFDDMINLRGAMCLGASWQMQAFYGRTTLSEIRRKKDSDSSVSFDMNYRAVWTGASNDALVTMSKLLNCRTLANCELKAVEGYDYVLGVDVARSDNSSNNQTSIAVLKVLRRGDGRVKEVQLVNLYAISGTLDFNAQAIEIKRIKEKYNASIIVIDENGLGRGNVQPHILGNQYKSPQQNLVIPKVA